MYKKSVLALALLFALSGASVAAFGQEDRSDALIDQLNGKSCNFEVRGDSCFKRHPFATIFRRSDKEKCIIDAARALGMMGGPANAAIPALIDALNKYRNVDSGDGIIPVRSEIALALGRTGDPSVVKPLIAVLGSDDQVILSESASVGDGYILIKGTTYGAVVEALGMLGAQAKEALPALNGLLVKHPGSLRAGVEAAIRKISE